MPVRDLMLEIAQAVPVALRLGRVLVLERNSKPMPVISTGVGALRRVGHDDVRVTVRRFTRRPMCVLDDLDQAVDMRILTEVMAMDVLVIVPVRHRPMLPVEVRCG